MSDKIGRVYSYNNSYVDVSVPLEETEPGYYIHLRTISDKRAALMQGRGYWISDDDIEREYTETTDIHNYRRIIGLIFKELKVI